jgi:hypothetical protein
MHISVCVVTRGKNYALSREARISHRLQEDLQIEPRAPVRNVVKIVRDPGVRLFYRIDLTRGPHAGASSDLPAQTAS